MSLGTGPAGVVSRSVIKSGAGSRASVSEPSDIHGEEQSSSGDKDSGKIVEARNNCLLCAARFARVRNAPMDTGPAVLLSRAGKGKESLTRASAKAPLETRGEGRISMGENRSGMTFGYSRKGPSSEESGTTERLARFARVRNASIDIGLVVACNN